MRNITILLCSALILTLFSFPIVAQEAQAQVQTEEPVEPVETEAEAQARMNLERFERRMMEYVQRVAGLTQAEADRFFPLNRELTRKKLELHRTQREKVEKMRESDAELTDEEFRIILESEVELRQQQAALDVLYNEKFLEFLSPQRLYNVQRAERTFWMRELANFREQQEQEQNQTQNEQIDE